MSDQPASEARVFESVEYTESAGFSMNGDDLRESETSLKVDLLSGVASWVTHQPVFPDDGEAMGTFRMVLSRDRIARLQTLLQESHLDAVRPGPPETPSRGDLWIRTTGKRRVRLLLSTGDLTNLAKLRPLLSELNRTESEVAGHPYQAIQVELQTRPGPDLRFTITIKNVGTEPVMVPDLAMLQRESPGYSAEHGIGVRVALEVMPPPGYTEPPPQWSRVEVVADEQPPPGKPFVLAPGAEHRFDTASWSAKPGRWWVQAFFCFYARGPKGDYPHLIRGLARSKGELLSR